MELYNAGDKLGAFKQCINLMEKKRNDYDFVSSTLNFINSKMDHLGLVTSRSFIDWLKAESAAGNSCAQDYLGDLYYYGHYVDMNREEAVRLFELSANNGNLHAMYNLSHMYMYGYGTSQNTVKALELCIKVKKSGCSYCDYSLSSHVKDNSEALFKILFEAIDAKSELEELKRKNREQEEEIEKLRTEIEYRPGGPGYERAKADAEVLFGQIVKN